MRGGCGPEAPCGRSLVAMERAHRQALEELQRQHDRKVKELETEKDRLLLEETQDTARGQQTRPGRKNIKTKITVLILNPVKAALISLIKYEKMLQH